ncbi:endonuclease III domain-containing protein [Deinococcus oregonensis]|uniref:Endonuclease III domain-containing protein n=1 Tax=Deinococcus oregonensis TaxID=1805970 RepID=A0ABV6AYE2_9DEIO
MSSRRYVKSKPARQLPADAERTRRAEEIGALFKQLGQTRGNQFPWHKSPDPFKVLVAEYLLARTARLVIERVYQRVIDHFPNAAALAAADPKVLSELTREAGLPRKTLGLIEVARRVTEIGEVPPNREWLLSLPFVGDYIADAVLLYAFGLPIIPLDRNFQRVVHRVFFGQEPPKRSIEPYRDPETVHVVDEMTCGYDARALRNFHQGVLIVAWDFCRHRPRITACPLSPHCALAWSLSPEVQIPG